MANEYSKIVVMIKRMMDILMSSHGHFQLWKALEDLLTSGNRVSKHYLEFFSLARDAHLQVFLIGLSTFFDNDKKALSLNKLLNYIESNFDSVVSESTSGVTALPDLQKQDICNYKKQIKKVNPAVLKLKNIRDQKIAHEQLKVEEITVAVSEIEDLFRVTHKVLNELSYKINKNSFDLGSNRPRQSLDFLLSCLEK